MKYCLVIMDGAAGWPLPERGDKTSLELARTPNLDAMTQSGILGLARTVPAGIEPSSAIACMSVLGYDPKVYYRGRAGIEARSMGIPVSPGEAVFRCNLVSVRDGRMFDYSSGHISTEEARQLVETLNESVGNNDVKFFPGISYRHILKLRGREDTLQATCTPPHDIPDRLISDFMPRGPGSDFLRHLMERSEAVLKGHPVNVARRNRGDVPASMVWLFWGSGQIPDMPSFREIYCLRAAMTSGVDLLHGLAQMMGMEILEIRGVTDGLDNDYAAQATGVLKALGEYDLVVTHIEAPDEAAHSGLINDKVAAIEQIDEEVLGRLRFWSGDALRVLVIADHPTPIKVRTHSSDPPPFLLWGAGFTANGASRFNEAEAKRTGLLVDPGYNIMGRLATGS